MTPNQNTATNRFPIFVGLHPAAACRDGFTILEVLISAGIMVIGLTCVAALLPAAAQRMSQAVSEDRAGTLAANAYADITARRSLGLFSASPGNTPWPKGESRLLGVAATVLANQMSATEHPDNTNLFASGSWEIQDALDFDESAGSPINTFFGGDKRKIRENPMCWLATLVPHTSASDPVEPGDVANLWIAIFKKHPQNCKNYSFVVNAGTISGIDDDERRQFLRGCTYVLDVTPGRQPVWRMVTASWSTGGNTSLVFDNPPPTNPNNTTLLGFANLLRVEKHRIVLD
jgi:type II secretory pathway pseudopilin PulG